MKLRKYQQEAVTAIKQQWKEGYSRTLLVLPTGCGKTIVFAKVTEECVREGKRVLILAHRSELLEQAADKLYKTTGIRSALEKAESSCLDSWYRVTVGSVQTLMREKRLKMFQPDFFDTIIIDEAHHAVSDSYQRILQHFSNSDILGVTATPDRGDMSPPTDNQKRALEKYGIYPDEIDNAGKAKMILDRLDKRRNAGLTTPKQIRFLESKGFKHVGTWDFEAAKSLIDRIAANDWRVPHEIDVSNYHINLKRGEPL